MAGPALFTGNVFIAKNEDWKQAFIYEIDYTVSGDPENIQPKDITDHTFKMQIRKVEADHTAVVSVQSGDGIEIVNAAGGEFQITITRDKLKRLSAGEYVCDLLIFDPEGSPDRFFDATCTVVEGTTR